MKKQLLALAAAVAVSPAAMAQQGYFGADFSFISTELSIEGFSGSEDVDPTALRVKAGANLNENFAIEGVLGLGLQDDELDDSGVDFGLDTLLAVYAVGIVPLDRSFSVFGKIGFAKVEYEFDPSYSIDDTGVTFGAGVSVSVNRNAAMTLEYTILPDVEDGATGIQAESDMISLGAQFSF